MPRWEDIIKIDLEIGRVCETDSTDSTYGQMAGSFEHKNYFRCAYQQSNL
jgi:hypothetical protein